MAADEVTPTLRPADPVASEDSALRKMLPSVVVVVVYLLIGIVAFWPVFPGISQRLFSADSDFTQSVWFLSWVPHALAHGLNPFFSNAIFVPTGVNLAQSTESPLLGLITAPFALLLNPVVRANLLMVLSMPVSATAAFVVLRRWKVWGPGAALGGLIYGFSPYMVAQGLGHVELIFVPVPPVIALTVVSIMQRSGSPRRLGIQLGLLVVAQYLISPEVLATVGIFTIAAVACVAISRRAKIAELARTVSEPVGIALVLAAALLAYPVWMMLAGPQHLTGAALSITNGYHNDLFNFVAPGPLQRVSLGMRSLGMRLDSGSNTTEAGGYIGIPLLILTGILVWLSRRSPRTQLTAVLLLGAALLSLGPYLAVDSHLTRIPLPFLLLDHLPLLDNILPIRISFEVGACIAALIAFGLDDIRRASARGNQYGAARRRRTQRWESVVFVGATLAVLVVTQLPQWPYVAPPATVLPASLLQAVPAGDPVAITYPYDTLFNMHPMLWQAEGGFSFRLLGGYAYHPGSSGHATDLPSPMSPRGLQQFLASGSAGFYGESFGPALPVSPELVATTRTSLSKYDVRLVIVDRSMSGSGPVMELFDDAIGPPTLSAGQFSMWADWHGRPSHEQFLSHLFTSVVRPANDAKVSGTTGLDATATGYNGVSKVEFLLTDGSHHSKLIAGGYLTPYGWFSKWNSTSVANGTYSLQSIAYDASGASRLSTSITITVTN